MDTNTQATTWRTRAAAVWARIRQCTYDVGGLPVVLTWLVVLLCAAAFAKALWDGEHQAKAPPAVEASTDVQVQIDALRLRVAALESLPPETLAPDPAPARPSVPRAAPRPTPHAAPAAPAEAPVRWGTTDLDRAIAATPSVNLEQDK